MVTINNSVRVALLKKLDKAFEREIEAYDGLERAVGNFNKQVARDELRDAIRTRHKAEEAVDRYYAMDN